MRQPFSITAKATPRSAMLAVGGLSVALIVLATLAGAHTGDERIIEITASRYEYSPGTIVLKKGEPVILELISRDRIHGFHVKALNVRADVLPGQSVRVRVVPDKVGVFPFTCDLFCGSGHGDMSGVISVTD